MFRRYAMGKKGRGKTVHSHPISVTAERDTAVMRWVVASLRQIISVVEKRFG